MPCIRTILADDQCIFVEGLKSVLQRSRNFRFDVLAEAFNGRDLIRMARKHPAELLILELNLPDKDGLDVIAQVRKERLPLKLLVLSRYDEPRIIKSAFKAGVDGYILKDKGVDELFFAIGEVMTGNTFLGEGVGLYDHPNGSTINGRHSQRFAFEDGFIKKHNLTKRETEILRLITEAMSNKEIAKELFISDQTVSVHRKNIMRKLGVSNTAALIKTAYENCMV